MKKTLLALIVLIAVLVIYRQQPSPGTVNTTQQVAKQHGLPWQIELDNGHSRVFGITLGGSTLANAIAVLDRDYELAVLAKYQQVGALELFYSHFSSGQLQGKLILVVDADDTLLSSLKTEAKSVGRLDNGTEKYQLSEQQFISVQPLPIRSITFAPKARLNQEMIELRFGSSQSIISTSETVTHYLYPQLGLDILIDTEGKDLLQYVAPKNFSALQHKLLLTAE